MWANVGETFKVSPTCSNDPFSKNHLIPIIHCKLSIILYQLSTIHYKKNMGIYTLIPPLVVVLLGIWSRRAFEPLLVGCLVGFLRSEEHTSELQSPC